MVCSQPFQSGAGALGEAMEVDIRDWSRDWDDARRVPPLPSMRAAGFKRTVAVLWFHLLGEDAPFGASQEDLMKALMRPGVLQTVVVLDEFFATYKVVRGNSEASVAYAKDNVPLMLRQLLRCLEVPFVIMGTQTRSMNAFTLSDESAGNNPRPFLHLVTRLPEVPFDSAQLAHDVIDACGADFTEALPALTHLLQHVRPRVRYYVRKALRNDGFSYVAAAYATRITTLGEKRVSPGGLLLDALRQLIARDYELSRSSAGTSIGRAARLMMHLGGSRPTKESDQCFPVQFFDNHHADFSAGSHPQPAPVSIVKDKDADHYPVGLRWEMKKEPLVSTAHFRPLDEEPLFHLLHCGGPALELNNTTVATTFVGPNNEPALLRTAWEEMSRVGNNWNFEKLFQNDVARKRSGDRGEAYFTLAAIGASHMHGLSARPRLDEFVAELVAHITGEREAAQSLVADFSRVFDACRNPELLAEVPFGSPSNTPWPAELQKLLGSLNVKIDSTTRPADKESFDLKLGSM